MTFPRRHACGRGAHLFFLLVLSVSSFHHAPTIATAKEVTTTKDGDDNNSNGLNHYEGIGSLEGEEDPRIVGGTPVSDRDTFAFFAAPTTSPLCGASLIGPDILVTAAHCEVAFKPGETTVMLGGTLRDGTDAQETYLVESIRLHPKFKTSSHLEYDCMLVKLATGEDGSSITPIEINKDPSVPKDNVSVRVIGYGHTAWQGSLSPQLMQVSVPVVSYAECSEGYSNLNNDLKLCAGAEGFDSCNGDSGGPLIHPTTGKLLGMVSYGAECAREGYPGVYARISAMLDFIENEVCEFSRFGCLGEEVGTTEIDFPTCDKEEEENNVSYDCSSLFSFPGKQLRLELLGLFCFNLCVMTPLVGLLRSVGMQCGGCDDA